MKRILGLAALLGHALGAATGIQVYGGTRGGRGKRPVYGNAYYSSSRPKAARWWHDINNPAQGLRFDAAVAKRQRRAEKLSIWAAKTLWGQPFQLRDRAHTPLAKASFFTADQCSLSE